MNTKGFTLLELLIAIAISGIVAAAGYGFFTNTFHFSVVHSRNIEMQRESRVAIDMISREIRSAGLGVKNPLEDNAVHPAAAAFPIITAGNAAIQPDQITLGGGFQQIGMLTCAAPPCANPVAADGATQVFVRAMAGSDPTNPTVVGETITLDGFYTGTVVAVAGPFGVAPDLYYTLNLSPPLNRDYSQNNGVLWLQQIVYSIAPDGSGAPALFRSVNGAPAQQVASGIEDLQFAYLLNNGTTVSNPPAVPLTAIPPIRAVRIGMLARARDPKSSASAVSTRPSLEDHGGAAAPDMFHRRMIGKVAEVRNLGF